MKQQPSGKKSVSFVEFVKTYFSFLFLIIFNSLGIGNSSDEIVEHRLKKGVERKLVSGKKFRVMQVDETTDV
jgi:hypothetical protein